MACCCGHAAWKREEVPDHKFDFIDVRDYHTDGTWTRARYAFLYVLVVKSFAVYVADIYTAVTLLALNHFNGSIYNKVESSPDNTVPVPITYSKWVFFGCIVFSFLLLAYEAQKCRAIVRSRDISYAYTNVMANNYYSLRSYDHFCLFSQINNSTKRKDEIAFFIFFTFKGWKRLIVADGPRQVINALTLFGLLEVNKFSTNVYDYYGGSIFTGIMLLTMIFTVIIFAGSVVLLLIASLLYLPLLCYIKGNLKEYCCHKIDKRITELVHIKKKQRVAKQAAIARAEANGDFKHLMNKKGIIVGQKMLQPTLPKVEVDLYNDGAEDEKTRAAAAAAAAGHSPLLGAMRYAGAGTPYSHGYGEDYGSQAHLVLNQDYAGDSASNFEHSVHGSTSEINQPSLPPSAFNSPDAYPLRFGGNGTPGPTSMSEMLGSSASAQNHLTAQLGPMGTSPQLFAQRVAGEASGLNGRSARSEAIQASAYLPTQRPGEMTDYNGVYHGQGSYEAQQQQQYSHDSAQGNYYDAAQAHAYADHRNGGQSNYDAGQQAYYDDYQTEAQDSKAYTGDLSAYAPYHDGDAFPHEHQSHCYSADQVQSQQRYDGGRLATEPDHGHCYEEHGLIYHNSSYGASNGQVQAETDYYASHPAHFEQQAGSYDYH